MAVATAPASLFSSVSAVRAVHRELQREYRAEGDSPELDDRIEAFLAQAQATGAILESEEDQAAVQSIIDLWATTLYRAGRHIGDITLAEFDPSMAPELDDSLAPYVGLASFGEKERELFFGRQKMIEHLIDRLRSDNFLIIIGPSGAGKSSLVLAGLLPAIRNGAMPGSDDWVILKRAVPGSEPLVSLARCVRPADAQPGWSAAQAAEMLHDPDHLKKLADAYAGGRTCVFVIDQFEELSTLCADEEIRSAVEENLVHLAESAEPRHIVIATMRSDFIGQIARQSAMQKLMERALEPVTPLSAPELREAIERPAERVGLKFEAGVVESLVHDILGEPAALPLLQFTLLKLWETRERNRVTAAAYRKLGGGRLALTRSADRFYENLIPEDRKIADRILLRMVRPGLGQDVVSSRIKRTSLDSIGDPDGVHRVLDKLIHERLVLLTEGDSPEDAEVEVAHEALVRNWGHLVQLLEAERERMIRGRRLEAKAADWVRLGRGRAGLLAGVALVEAQEWVHGEDARILGASPGLLELIAASEKAERAAARRAFWIRVALIVLTIASLFFAFVSWMKMREAVRSEAEAQKQEANAVTNWNKLTEANKDLKDRERKLEDTNKQLDEARKALDEKAHLYDSDHLADAAQKTLLTDPDVSTLRAVESAMVLHEVGKPGSTETADALRKALSANRARLVITGHGGNVEDAAFSPDGRHIVTAGGGKPMHWFNSVTGSVEPVSTAATGSAVAYSVYGAWAAADARQGLTVHFASGKERTLATGDRVTRLVFSADGRRLAAAAGTHAYVWDLQNDQDVTDRPPIVQKARINSVALSFDGSLLATASDDALARVSDASSGELLRELKGHNGPVRDIAFSSTATQIATAGQDRTAKLWPWLDATRPDPIAFTLPGHLDAVTSVAYSPDGTMMATSSQDRTAKIWSLTGLERFSVSGHNSPIRRVQFNADSSRLLTAGDDGAVRVWNAGPAEDLQTASLSATGLANFSTASPISIPPPPLRPEALIATPDGKTIVTSHAGGVFRIWNLTAQGVALQKMVRRQGPPSSVVAIDPSGTVAAVSSGTSSIGLYDVQSGAQQRVLTASAGVIALALSADGKRLLSGSTDKQIRLWDVQNGSVSASYDIGARVDAVAITPDSRRAAAVTDDGRAIVLMDR